jgi:hypothetical protein
VELKASIAYRPSATNRFDGSASRATAPTRIGTRRRARSGSQAAAFVAACLIEAIVILGFVVMSLGIGAEGEPGLGPGRSAPPTTPAPAPPPDPRSGSVMTGCVGEGTPLLAGHGA